MMGNAFMGGGLLLHFQMSHDAWPPRRLIFFSTKSCPTKFVSHIQKDLVVRQGYEKNCVAQKCGPPIHFFLIITNLIRTPRLRFAISWRAVSKTNDCYRKWNVKNDRASSQIHFKGIILCGVGGNFEMCQKI